LSPFFIDCTLKVPFLQPTVFSGTVRTALDPFSLYDDARLWDALRRSFLVDSEAGKDVDNQEIDEKRNDGDAHAGPRITLDTVLEAEGLNLSVGERSLLSLARALVKDTKVVVLDEATYARFSNMLRKVLMFWVIGLR